MWIMISAALSLGLAQPAPGMQSAEPGEETGLEANGEPTAAMNGMPAGETGGATEAGDTAAADNVLGTDWECVDADQLPPEEQKICTEDATR